MPSILVTGTTSGIGEQVARYLLKQPNTKVFGVARREAPDQLANNENYRHIQGDTTKAETIEKIRDTVGPKLDGVVFNAGAIEVKRIENIEIEDLRKVYEVNVMSVVLLTQALLPALRATHGRALYMSSAAAREGFAGWSIYASSKAASDRIAFTLSNEEPVIAFAVDPGIVDTSMQGDVRDKHVKSGQMKQEDADKFASVMDEGKLASPEEVGAFVGDLVLRATKEQAGKLIPHKKAEGAVEEL